VRTFNASLRLKGRLQRTTHKPQTVLRLPSYGQPARRLRLGLPKNCKGWSDSSDAD